MPTDSAESIVHDLAAWTDYSVYQCRTTTVASCRLCESTWVRGGQQEHEHWCPIGRARLLTASLHPLPEAPFPALGSLDAEGS